MNRSGARESARFVLGAWRSRSRTKRVLTLLALTMMLAGAAMLAYPLATHAYSSAKQKDLNREFVSLQLKRDFEAGRITPGQAVTRIVIEKLGIDSVVVEGTDLDDLRAGAGHYRTTALACEAGNAAIAGHRTTYGKPFNRLDELRPGDVIRLITPSRTCDYVVVEGEPGKPRAGPGAAAWITHPKDGSVLEPLPGSMLTLTTCHPKGSDRKRLILRAQLKPPPAPSPLPSPTPTPIDVAAINDPLQIRDLLIATELRIRSDETPFDAYEQLGRTQQAVYRKLVANPDWQAIAIGGAPESLKEVIKRNIEAGAELRSLTKPVSTIPSWKIVAPPPTPELRGYYGEAEQRFGIKWAYLASIHLVESRFGRIRGTSSAGAQGPMQFLPSTWERYGEGDINDPRDSILAAGRYLKAAGAPADMHKALYAYNHSERYVRAVTIYAEHMLALERAYHAYYHWQVYVRTTTGDVLLEVGYGG